MGEGGRDGEEGLRPGALLQAARRRQEWAVESAGGGFFHLIYMIHSLPTLDQIAASLMSNLEATVPSNDSDPTVAQKREHTMEKWMR